jgi:hypothetical protein
VSAPEMQRSSARIGDPISSFILGASWRAVCHGRYLNGGVALTGRVRVDRGACCDLVHEPSVLWGVWQGRAASMSSGVNRCTHRKTVTWSTSMPRSASNSSTSLYESRSAVPAHSHHDHVRRKPGPHETGPRRSYSTKGGSASSHPVRAHHPSTQQTLSDACTARSSCRRHRPPSKWLAQR